jgi:hypothetical protein
MGTQQSKLGSVVEAVTNTAASMVVFLSFGLPVELVLGLTISMFIKNIVIRRVFHSVAKRWGF